MQRCLGCMREFGEEFDVCPHCGYIVGTTAASKNHLAPGTVLQERYILGKALGESYFGVMYIAWDNKVGRAVAIKEFFPSFISLRTEGGKEICCVREENRKQYESLLEQTLQRARTYVSLNEEGIARMYDCFEENKTAYFVLELLYGKSLREQLRECGNLSFAQTMRIMTPVLETLDALHRKGLLYYTVNPDKIFVCDDGSIRLLDILDAVVFVDWLYQTRSYVIRIFPEEPFTPLELYARSRKEMEGTWTDVYGACTTMYRMLTGATATPERYVDTKPEEDSALKALSKSDAPKQAKRAIVRGMKCQWENRTRTVGQLLDELKVPETLSIQPRKGKKRIILAAALVLLAAVGAVMCGVYLHRKNADGSRDALRQALSETVDAEILSFSCADFNADGSPEAFAICGQVESVCKDPYGSQEDSVDMDIAGLQLWFVNSQKTVLLDDRTDTESPAHVRCASIIPVTHDENISAFMFGEETIHTWYSLFLLDEKGEPFLSVSGADYEPALIPEPVGNWITLRESYGTFGCRESYFQYDSDAHDLIRLGGLEISESALKNVEGTEEAFRILADEHAIIDSILYRANGLVHINYYRGDLVEEDFDISEPGGSGLFARSAMTLLIRDGKAQIFEKQDQDRIGMNFFAKTSMLDDGDVPSGVRTVTPEAFPY